MDILHRVIEDKCAAVGQLAAQRQMMALPQFQQQILTQLTQIAGDNQVEVIGRSVEVVHMRLNRIKSRRRHSGAHVVGIFNAQIRNGANGAALDPRTCSGGADQSGTCAGDCPLSSGSALTSVAQRETVLPLGRREVGRSHRSDFIGKTASDHHCGDQQAFCHGGTGTVQTKMGNTRITETEGRTDALIQKIAGQYQIEVAFGHIGLFCQLFQRQLLHPFLCLFPGPLAEKSILGSDIKGMRQRPLRLFFSRDTGPAADDRQLRQYEALLSAFVDRQNNTLFYIFPSMCIFNVFMKKLAKSARSIIMNKKDEVIPLEKMKIRPAVQTDLNEIEAIYAAARRFMVENGNPTQWNNGYPKRELLEQDLALHRLYAVENEKGICGVFVFIIGEDPTYGYMEGGSWRSDTTYGTIHRIASTGKCVFTACLEFCRGKCGHIRVDTHADNKPMQHLAEKHGFSRRGIIYVADGTPRIAYDLL